MIWRRLAIHIWVLGSSNIDTTYTCKTLPKEGQTLLAESVSVATGGKGANQAFAARSAGAPVEFIGAVGSDKNADLLMEALSQAGIGTRYLQRAKGVSGCALIVVDNKASNFIIVLPGANTKIPTDMDIEFKPGDLLIAQFEINMDAIQTYFSRVKLKGAVTVLNPSPVKDIPESLYQTTDILVVNEDEAFSLAGIKASNSSDTAACAQRLTGFGPTTVILTLGSKGVYTYTNGKGCLIRGHKVQPVDTQGAGDAFLGFFAAMLATGKDMQEAVRYANAAAALSVTKQGSTQHSMPTMKEVEMILS